jgi:sigma-B regulation protein RsbU (phosphoserine phosphatase)
MMGWYVAVFLLLVLAGFGWAVFKSRRRRITLLDLLSRENNERAEREHRLFEFFHELGATTVKAQLDSMMHRVIAEGAAKVMGAQGGALYLFDEETQVLVPKHYSKGCPPLLALPENIINQAQTNAGTLASFLRLNGVNLGTGLLGAVFDQRVAEKVPDLLAHIKFDGKENFFQEEVAAMMAPLIVGKKKLGVLAVANAKPSKPFNDDDLEVFQALADQCAFAIGSRFAHAEATKKKAMEAELRNASEIQRVLLPEKAPLMEGFEIAGRNVPAALVSGDYYDFIPIGDKHLGAVIADVCGKGISASLITAMCRSVLRANARNDLSPASVLASVNRNLFPDIRVDMFITISYIVIANDGSTVTLARAGHTDPMLWRKSTGKVEEIKSPGLAVGLDKGDVFERVTKDVTIQMESGDVLLLYTDGVNEATDQKEAMFGEDHIMTTLAEAAPRGVQRVVEALIEDVDTFMAGDPKTDDITIVALRKK